MIYENLLFLFRYCLYAGIFHLVGCSSIALAIASIGVVAFFLHFIYGIFPLAGNDEVWLFDRPQNRCTIVGSIITEKFDGNKMKQHFLEKLDSRMEYVKRTGTPVVEWMGSHFYKNKVDSDYWLELMVSTKEPLHDRESLSSKMAELQQEPFPAGKPKWKVCFFENYMDGKQSAMVYKIHHSIGDGMALTGFLLGLCDQFPDLKIPQLPKATAMQKIMIYLTLPITYPYYMLKALIRTPDKNVLHGRRLSGKKLAHIGNPISLPAVKRYCSDHHISLNEFFLATYTAALKQYITKVHGKDSTPSHLTLAIPFSIRNIPTDGSLLPLNNEISILSMHVPLTSADFTSHMDKIVQIFHKMKHSFEPYVTLMIQKSVAILPTRVAEMAFRYGGTKQSVVYSNVPGPCTQMTFDGKLCHELNYFVPALANIGIGVSMYSYVDKVCHSCFGDEEVLKDPALACDIFERLVGDTIEGKKMK